MMDTKRCTRCAEEKPLTEFSALAASSDGRAPGCKTCAAKQYAVWRHANKQKLKISKAAYHAANRVAISAKHAIWRASNNDTIKARGAEYRASNRETAKANSVAWRANNTAQSRATVAAWRATNPEKAKAIIAAFHAANPGARRIYGSNRRARRSGGALSRGLVKKLFKLQQGRCPCCRLPLGSDYQLDHKMPLVLGGANTDDNMQLLRKPCNLSKNAKHPVTFMQIRGFLL